MQAIRLTVTTSNGAQLTYELPCPRRVSSRKGAEHTCKEFLDTLTKSRDVMTLSTLNGTFISLNPSNIVAVQAIIIDVDDSVGQYPGSY